MSHDVKEKTLDIYLHIDYLLPLPSELGHVLLSMLSIQVNLVLLAL